MSDAIKENLQPTESLYKPCDLNQFESKTTSDLEVLTEFVGQDRALQSSHISVRIRRQGINLFPLGEAGTGKPRIPQ